MTLHDDDALLAARVRSFAWMSGALWLAHALLYLSLGRVWIGTTHSVATVLTALSALLYWRGAIGARTTAHALAGIVTFALAGAAVGTGQSTATATWFLILVPLGMGSAVGRRAAVGWTVVVVIAMAALHLGRAFRPVPPEYEVSDVELFVAHVTLAGIALAVALAARDAADRHLAEIQAQAAELVVTRDAALAASRTKSTFLATMTHEIRTPLNGVLGMARLLAPQARDPRAREQVETIRASGETLLALVNDILDFSKIEAGKVELRPEPTATKALLEDAVRVVRHAADEKGLPIALAVDASVPEAIEVDRSKLRQMLVNLLSNAVKFTDAGRIDVQARTEGADLAIAVRDTGVGIAEDQLPQLFDAFRQIDGSATRRHEGTGLGLSISRGLARAMGGDISVESSPGRGSTFTLRVPARPAELPEKTPESRPALPALRILLVEDNPLNELVAQRMLEQLGQHAEVERDGPAAILRTEREAFDVVLLDYRLPVRSGPEVAREIRARGGAQPYLVAVTANATAADRAECAAAGMDAFLAKPVELEALAHALAKAPLPLVPPATDDIEDVLGGDFEGLIQVADALEEQLEQARSEIREGGLRKDARAAFDWAHRLRPNAALFGLVELTRAARQWEVLARQESDALWPALVEAPALLDAALARLRERREGWRRRLVQLAPSAPGPN